MAAIKIKNELNYLMQFGCATTYFRCQSLIMTYECCATHRYCLDMPTRCAIDF